MTKLKENWSREIEYGFKLGAPRMAYTHAGRSGYESWGIPVIHNRTTKQTAGKNQIYHHLFIYQWIFHFLFLQIPKRLINRLFRTGFNIGLNLYLWDK